MDFFHILENNEKKIGSIIVHIYEARSLFGVETLETVSMLRLTLPKNPGVDLKESKLISLARKYSSIPAKYKKYYPVVEKQLKELTKEKLSSVPRVKRKRPGSSVAGRKKRRVGRPKKKRPPLRSIANTPSILTFFSITSE